MEIDFMDVSSYGTPTPSGEVRILKDLSTSVEGGNCNYRRYCGHGPYLALFDQRNGKLRREESGHRHAPHETFL